tara:strand:- start:1210 stop:1821 length:612 start_codon:yes stop_codon:yes gene_type:complete
MFKHYLRASAAIGALVMISGCSSLNVGESEFECEGKPGDFHGNNTCRSADEVYAMTDNGEVPLPVTEADRKAAAGNDQGPAKPTAANNGVNPVDPVTRDYVTPALPNRPVPIRTPARVMRIWVSPWEDTVGNLNVPGYVYTEIEPRRWTIGSTPPTASPTLTPLQITPSASEQANSQGRSRSSQREQRREDTSLPPSERPWLR